MKDRDRLEQLRGMLDRLERMPPSPDRDWMLGEVRARAVDVETGVRGTMRRLPTDESDVELAVVARPSINAARAKTGATKPYRGIDRRSAWSPPRARLAHAAPLSAPLAAREGATDLLAGDGLLCLEDPASSAVGSTHAWRRGLRG
jgi:hypothetical protein